ncbi:MAG: hypothetical protein H6R10_3527 [Rhodocyclaceae bacterium]|nr:hypothetical protein [Rhodocyclaceae bacterium]
MVSHSGFAEESVAIQPINSSNHAIANKYVVFMDIYVRYLRRAQFYAC